MPNTRCAWVGDDPLYQQYHDGEWGVPCFDDRTLFEFLILEGAQAGLSWITVLRKREHYRLVFDGFDAEKIARSEPPKSARKPSSSAPAKSANVTGPENDLQAILGLNVEIEANGESGYIRVDYTSLEQLDDLCARLSKSPNKSRKK